MTLKAINNVTFCHFSVKSLPNLITEFKLFPLTESSKCYIFFFNNVIKLLFEKGRQTFCWYFREHKELLLILELSEE